MSEKSAPGGKWANPALLEALAMGFHTVAKGEGLTKEAKDAVILKIHAYGFTDITWEAVRSLWNMSRSMIRWTAEIDQQILVAMVKTMVPSTDQYSLVIDELHALGHTMTVSALKQHIQKLQRKELPAGDGGEGEASASATPKKAGKKAATPKKSGTPATPRKRKTPAKSKAKVEEADEEDEEDEQEAPPPKKPCTPSRPSMKDEVHEDTKTTGAKFVPVNEEI
ncbi:hypothetical protein COL516b_005997 [Colletotrichum fioriniae]|nr:uncharacterized protein COL516b_005997 [Colletotrichum fioriniae]KAJ0304107.1 hypothetical protein COL516b_005997 [Colletotrichum fioriniae]